MILVRLKMAKVTHKGLEEALLILSSLIQGGQAESWPLNESRPLEGPRYVATVIYV